MGSSPIGVRQVLIDGLADGPRPNADCGSIATVAPHVPSVVSDRIAYVWLWIRKETGDVNKPQRETADETDQEYRAIEATLLGSARGRWFLAEHGRRARRMDSVLLEDALARLKTSLREPTGLLMQLAAEIELVRDAVATARASLMQRDGAATSGRTSEAPAGAPVVQRLLRLAEDMHELTWTLQGREGRDFDQGTCEQIARQAASMYALSVLQGGHTEARLDVAARLDAAERRLAALLDMIGHEAVGA